MSRSVKVILEGDVGRYVISIKEAKSATEGLDNKVESLNRDLDKVPAASARAAASMKLLNLDSKSLGDTIENSGKKFDTSLKVIEGRITATKNELRKFADEFNKTGSSDALAGLFSAKTELKKLEGLQKSVSDALKRGGEEGSKSLLSSIQGVLSTPVLGPLTGGMIAGLAVVLAPALGAAIGATVIGGGGLSLIGLGIASQIHSPAVVAAFGQLKEQAKDDLTDAAGNFEPALVNGLHEFGDHLARFMPSLARSFNALVLPFQNLLGSGAGGFLDRLGPGLEELAAAAAPLVNVIAAWLPEFGGALTQMFHDISLNAPGAILFFQDLLGFLDGLIVAIGKVSGGLEKAYGWFRTFSDFLIGKPGQAAVEMRNFAGAQEEAAKQAKEMGVRMQVAAASIDIAGGKAMSASDQYGSLISQLHAVNNTADTVAGAMVDKWVGSMLSADLAANNFDKSLITLGDTLVANGGQLSAHVNQLKKSETGAQQNKDAILAVVQANLQEYDSQIASGIAATDAAAKYDENTKALEDQLRAAGYTTQQIDDLIGKYRSIPDKVDSNIAINGLTDAINDMNDLTRLINHLPSRTITIQNVVYTNQPADQTYHGYALGGIRRAQVGMLIPPSSPGTVLTAEPQTGGEALIPLRGISQMRAAALGQVAMGGYGLDVVPRGYRSAPRFGGDGGTLRVELAFAGGNDALSSLLMKMQRTGDLQITATRV